MKIGPLDSDQKVLIVAEIGNNHEGSFVLAEELIGRAAATGVDAVKFQTFIPEHYVSRDQSDRHQATPEPRASHESHLPFDGVRRADRALRSMSRSATSSRARGPAMPSNWRFSVGTPYSVSPPMKSSRACAPRYRLVKSARKPIHRSVPIS